MAPKSRVVTPAGFPLPIGMYGSLVILSRIARYRAPQLVLLLSLETHVLCSPWLAYGNYVVEFGLILFCHKKRFVTLSCTLSLVATLASEQAYGPLCV